MTDNKLDLRERIDFRPITEEDIEFLYAVYRSVRMDEIGMSEWPEKEREEFIRSQFDLQHTQYMRNYPNPTFEIILLDGIPVGRLFINWGSTEIRIIDIALLHEYRGRGIGSILINDIIKKSEEKNIPISLHVEYYNFAKQWYEKLGFEVVRQVGVYFYMVRTP